MPRIWSTASAFDCVIFSHLQLDALRDPYHSMIVWIKIDNETKVPSLNHTIGKCELTECFRKMWDA